MNRINCMIADDEQLAREIIEVYVHQLDQLNLVAVCSNGTEVYNALKVNTVDLLFLDIQMPHLTGIELLRIVKNPPLVIMTTAHREFALEGYELNVIDYLLKPISFERFLKAVAKYESIRNPGSKIAGQPVILLKDDQQAFIYVKSDKKMVRILLKDILYIEGLKDYVKIQLEDKMIITYQTMSYFEEKLSANHFIRVHRSYIVSLDHISAYSATQIDIGNTPIPIGGSYGKEVLKKLTTS
ncbi:LytTR family DNA-binding domain-containing protein [Pedobacter sp. L105]|uniref:LytR/AlgR family response regulator transcription factor n=1 Tax=Pedobacter sp. L105 TaxID=1641871 RepID=UPI00131B6443|nr:LytTR family DNA-binding domain-containing protein [Pedobacter sp. L105]